MHWYLLLTATHSLRSSPSGSSTANLRLPEPRVAAACFIRSYWWVPSGIFFLGLKVFDDLPPLQKKKKKLTTKNNVFELQAAANEHCKTLTIGSSLWLCLEHKPNVSWQTIVMNKISKQYRHLPTTCTQTRSLVWYTRQQKRTMSVNENKNIKTQKWAKETNDI